MFRREIRVNYGKLEGISDAVSAYLTALDEMQQNVDILLQQISGGSGEAYERLVERGSSIKGQINGCREELDGLQTLLCGYSQDMQALIRPCSQYQSMLVDRNDIWANLETIRGLCERFNQLGAGMLVSAPGFPFNPLADQEEKEAEEENYRIVEEVRESIQSCYRNHIQECMGKLDALYQNHVIEYENKDDEYAEKAFNYYKNHTEPEDYINHILGEGLETCGSFFEGLGNSLLDLLTGIAELGKGVLWFVGAGIPYLVCEAGDLDKPDWVKEGVENPIDSITKALGNPGTVLEGIAQQVTDCGEQKGYAYCTGYGIGSVVGIKGLDKISKVAKVTKATKEVTVESEVVGGVSEIADGAAADSLKSGLTKTQIDDILNIPKGRRPDPSTYLSQEYIKAHLAQFDDGAAYILPKKTYDLYYRGTPKIAREDGTLFVTSKEYLNDVLEKANGNLSYVAKALGYPEGVLSNGEFKIININNPSQYKINIPSGNEAGANSEWIPGGYTSGDVPEAVVNHVPNNPDAISVNSIELERK